MKRRKTLRLDFSKMSGGGLALRSKDDLASVCRAAEAIADGTSASVFLPGGQSLILKRNGSTIRGKNFPKEGGAE